jgi:UDP-N-acetyl-D-mannosaminuronic acid transferase (WecB/TagA/CpsF family)
MTTKPNRTITITENPRWFRIATKLHLKWLYKLVKQTQKQKNQKKVERTALKSDPLKDVLR